MADQLPLPGLSILLPCFNEVDNVREAITQARAAARQGSPRCEAIVVDDGSEDGTGAAARSIARLDPCVKVVAHEENRGYGEALRTGIAAATMPWILLTDADLQFDLTQLDRLARLAGEKDLIVGRRVPRAGHRARRPRGRSRRVDRARVVPRGVRTVPRILLVGGRPLREHPEAVRHAPGGRTHCVRV